MSNLSPSLLFAISHSPVSFAVHDILFLKFMALERWQWTQGEKTQPTHLCSNKNVESRKDTKKLLIEEEKICILRGITYFCFFNHSWENLIMLRGWFPLAFLVGLCRKLFSHRHGSISILCLFLWKFKRLDEETCWMRRAELKFPVIDFSRRKEHQQWTEKIEFDVSYYLLPYCHLNKKPLSHYLHIFSISIICCLREREKKERIIDDKTDRKESWLISFTWTRLK